MTRYVVLFYGTYDETNTYVGYEANSKEELVNELNIQKRIILSENKKYHEYEREAFKVYEDSSIEDPYTIWMATMEKCPYRFTSIQEIMHTTDEVFEFPDEFWNHVSRNNNG